MRFLSISLLSGCLLSGAALFSSPARAKPPDPSTSTVPPWIFVVGNVNDGQTPDPMGQATIITRDLFGLPQAADSVVIDFSACCDISLCGAIVNGQAVDCSGSKIGGTTDREGKLRFTILG